MCGGTHCAAEEDPKEMYLLLQIYILVDCNKAEKASTHRTQDTVVATVNTIYCLGFDVKVLYCILPVFV